MARHDPKRFVIGTPGYIGTNDEESSGIIDMADILGEGWFLIDVQAPHPPVAPGLVAGGQLLALHIPPGRR